MNMAVLRTCDRCGQEIIENSDVTNLVNSMNSPVILLNASYKRCWLGVDWHNIDLCDRCKQEFLKWVDAGGAGGGRMTNVELINALRFCADADSGSGCAGCTVDDWEDCCGRLLHDAADALEVAEKRIATYQSDVADLEQREKELNDVLNERARLITELNTKCADLQSQINSTESEIEEQLPKEGEWIEENRRPKSYAFVCSECGRTAYDVQPTRGEWPKRCRYAYCPNCGARMKGEQE